MKKLDAMTGIILIFCVCVSSAAASLEAPAREESRASVTTEAGGYVVKDSCGKIAVFRSGESAPLTVTRTRTESLPKSDAKRVKEGIEVTDETELKRVLEDFCS